MQQALCKPSGKRKSGYYDFFSTLKPSNQLVMVSGKYHWLRQTVAVSCGNIPDKSQLRVVKARMLHKKRQ
jgi:hypothetical protein